MARWFPPSNSPPPSSFGLNDIRALLDDSMKPMRDAISDLKAQMAIITDRSAQRSDLERLSGDVEKLRTEMKSAFGATENQFYSRAVLDERERRVQDRFGVLENRITAVEQSEQNADSRQRTQRFTQGQNAIFWAMGALGVVLTIIGTALAVASHLTFHP